MKFQGEIYGRLYIKQSQIKAQKSVYLYYNSSVKMKFVGDVAETAFAKRPAFSELLCVRCTREYYRWRSLKYSMSWTSVRFTTSQDHYAQFHPVRPTNNFLPQKNPYQPAPFFPEQQWHGPLPITVQAGTNRIFGFLINTGLGRLLLALFP